MTTLNSPEQTVTEDVMLKIQKLLALGESRNQNESALALAKATELLQRYNLDMAEVQGFGAAPTIEELDTEPDQLVDKKKRLKFNIYDRRWSWIKRVAYALARANMCEVMTTNGRIRFIGPKQQLPVMTYMFYSVFNQTIELMRKAGSDYSKEYMATNGVSPTHVRGADHISVFTRSWLDAAVDQIVNRLADQTETFKAERRTIQRTGEAITGQELVVVSQSAIEAYKREKYPWMYEYEKRPPAPVKTAEQLAAEEAQLEEMLKRVHKHKGGRQRQWKAPKERLVNYVGVRRGRTDGASVTFSQQGLKGKTK